MVQVDERNIFENHDGREALAGLRPADSDFVVCGRHRRWNVHFLFSNGEEFTPPKNLTNWQGRQVGTESPKIAGDRQTIGWLATFPNCCTSYPIPMGLVIYKLNHPLRKAESDQMIWRWMFAGGGSEVAFVQGPTHGTDIGGYKLYDAKTGKLLLEVHGPLNSSSPQWARALDMKK